MTLDDRPQQFETRDHYLALLERLDVPVEQALKAVGIDKSPSDAGGEMLDPETFYAFAKVFDELSADPELALRIGREGARLAFEPRYMSFDPPLFAAHMSPTWLVMIQRISRFSTPRSPVTTTVSVTEASVALEYIWPGRDQPPAILSLTESIYWIEVGRLRTRSDFSPRRVTVPNPPSDIAPFEEFFGVPVEASDRHLLVVDADVALRPFIDVTPKIWEHFEPGLERELARHRESTDLVDTVPRILATLLPAGQGTVEAVARELDMSARTLQRRLQLDGTSFREVLSHTRETLAIHYLTNTKRSITDISRTLGYDNSSSFTRAVRAWTGYTPRQVRQSGYTPRQVRQSGYTPRQVRQSGYTPRQVRQSAYTPRQVRRTGP